MQSKGDKALSPILGLGSFRWCSCLGSFFPDTPKVRFRSTRAGASSRKNYSDCISGKKPAVKGMLFELVKKLGLMDNVDQKIIEGDYLVHQNLDEALKQYELAAFSRQKGERLLRKFFSSSLRRAESLDNLAKVAKDTGRNWDALTHFLDAIRIREACFSPAWEMATSYANAGLVILELPGHEYPRVAVGVLARAVAFCSVSLKSKVKMNGSETTSYLDLAAMHNNLGRALLRNHKMEEALKHFRLALAATKVHPSQHIQKKDGSYPEKARATVAKCYTNIANVLADLSGSAHQSEALKYYSFALHIHEITDHSSLETAKSHEDVALILHEIGDLNAAEQHFQFAINIRQFRLENEIRGDAPIEDKVAFINSLNNIALVLRDKGQLSDALDCLNRALEKTEEGGIICTQLEVAWILGTIGRLHDEIYLE
mmetsp:Transcript_12947/g.37967  ORF Transcript_12947/g.37967 Transcript_12947/m.37967 type:complete len:429 (-) Transcript_12947:123-1409(-)